LFDAFWSNRIADMETAHRERWKAEIAAMHFGAAKQSATRVARIERAMPAIFEGRGFLERR